MTARDLVTGVLLAFGVGIELAAALGLLLMRTAIDRLHYTSLATTTGPIFIAAAVLAEESVSSAGITAILVALLLIGLNSALSTATARLARGDDT